MIDIIERLRRYAGGMCISTPTEQEAADIIEGLRAELSIERQWVAEYRRQAVRLSDEIKAMKQQEPVAWIRGRDDHRRRKLSFEKPAKSSPDKLHWSPLYALPGAQPGQSIPEAVMEVIAGLVYEVERNICPHEETHRGGQWEICDMCGAKWADDRGGKPEFKWPEVVERARAMLAAAPEAKP